MFKRSASSTNEKQSKHVELTPEKRAQILANFRKLLGSQNEDFDDPTLMRFLTARSFELEKAKQQLLDTVAWREAQKVEEILLPVLNPSTPVQYPVRGFAPFIDDQNVTAVDGIPDSLLQIYKYFGGNAVHKTDKEGRGVYIERLGHHDAKQIAKNIKREDLINWHISCQEFSHRVLMPELSKRAGKIIDKETVIFDCDGMGLRQLHMPALTLYQSVADLDQKYYPERLGRLFVVNTPFMFVKVWNLVKKWLDPGMLKKVHILGNDFKSVLLDHIPAENLPSFLGGTCTCSHLPGGCVPSVVLKTIPPITRSTLGPTPIPSRAPSPVPPESREAGYPGRVRVSKGGKQTREIIVTKEDANDNKSTIEVKFRMEQTLGVKFEASFVGIDDTANNKDSETLLQLTAVSDAVTTHTFSVEGTGEFVLTWVVDDKCQTDSVVIEYSLLVDGVNYADD